MGQIAKIGVQIARGLIVNNVANNESRERDVLENIVNNNNNNKLLDVI